jgi:hypothetical protein
VLGEQLACGYSSMEKVESEIKCNAAQSEFELYLNTLNLSEEIKAEIIRRSTAVVRFAAISGMEIAEKVANHVLDEICPETSAQLLLLSNQQDEYAMESASDIVKNVSRSAGEVLTGSLRHLIETTNQ